MSEEPDDTPDFGPPGYLPEKAARRARKIILRAPLGLQWIIASLLAGVVVFAAALVFFTQAGGPPGEPFVEIGPLDAIDATYLAEDHGMLLVGVSGRVRAFAVDLTEVPIFCPESRRLESPRGRVWSPTGRALDGGASLREHPTVVVDSVVYADPGTSVPTEPGEDAGVEPACF